MPFQNTNSLIVAKYSKGEIVIDSPGDAVVSFWEAGVLNFVVEDAGAISSKTIVPGTYVSSRELLVGTGLNPAIEFDDGFIYDDCQLLCTIANGRYCGGGFCSSPRAELSDGMIDVCIINKIGRLKLFSFLKRAQTP